MPRPPLFDRPMTVTERVRRHRARKRQEQAPVDLAPSTADLRRWLIFTDRADADDRAPAEAVRAAHQVAAQGDPSGGTAQ